MRYFLDTDGDGRWYIVPEAVRRLWGWAKERGWGDVAPWDHAIAVNGHPNAVTFALPILFEEPVGEWTT